MIPYFPGIPAEDKVEHSPAILSVNQWLGSARGIR
jgi:hypothetical protein